MNLKKINFRPQFLNLKATSDHASGQVLASVSARGVDYAAEVVMDMGVDPKGLWGCCLEFLRVDAENIREMISLNGLYGVQEF